MTFNLTRALAALLFLAGFAFPANAERIKDLTQIRGVRTNQLIGYGLVVGLDGSGDQTTQTPFTVQAFSNMLSQLGINMPPGTQLQLKNVAAVMVTAVLPAFAKPGQAIDVTVSSVGNAKSVRGGTLLMTPLKGADGQIYAMAQGNVMVGGIGAEGAGGTRVTVNHLSAGRVPAGATVERAVATALGDGDSIYFELGNTDFSTVSRIVEAINRAEPDSATAMDGRVVRVRAPQDANDRIAFLSRIESLNVTPAPTVAKVILNSRTGSVVMNQTVTVEGCAIAHGNLSVIVSVDPVVSQPAPFARQGRTVETQRSSVEIRADQGGLVLIPRSVSLGEVVKALNAMGASPQDLLAILQAMKAAGALRAELEII